MQALQHNSRALLKIMLTGLLLTTTYFVGSAQISAEEIKTIIDKEVYQKEAGVLL